MHCVYRVGGAHVTDLHYNHEICVYEFTYMYSTITYRCTLYYNSNLEHIIILYSFISHSSS